MMHLSLLAIAHNSIVWSPKVAVVMILCNIIGIAIGKFALPQTQLNAGPSLPAPGMFGGMGFPALLATCSLGHVIGAGAILGLSSVGYL
ncbi:MAG: photosystem I reaction center subunit PsaK [Cyanobacteria bacterium P01_D01_bin.73]